MRTGVGILLALLTGAVMYAIGTSDGPLPVRGGLLLLVVVAYIATCAAINWLMDALSKPDEPDWFEGEEEL
jgi:hypothetical protein